jgi:hypothetical protein
MYLNIRPTSQCLINIDLFLRSNVVEFIFVGFVGKLGPIFRNLSNTLTQTHRPESKRRLHEIVNFFHREFAT